MTLKGQSASDNWFDLYPGRSKRVTLKFDAAVQEAELRSALRVRSLVEDAFGDMPSSGEPFGEAPPRVSPQVITRAS